MDRFTSEENRKTISSYNQIQLGRKGKLASTSSTLNIQSCKSFPCDYNTIRRDFSMHILGIIKWPMLMSSLGTPRKFVKDYYPINNVEGYVKLGGFKGSLVGLKRFIGNFVSFYLVKKQLYLTITFILLHKYNLSTMLYKKNLKKRKKV